MEAFIGKSNPHAGQKNPQHHMTIQVTAPVLRWIAGFFNSEPSRLYVRLSFGPHGVFLNGATSENGRRFTTEPNRAGRYALNVTGGGEPDLTKINPPFALTSVQLTQVASSFSIVIPFPAERRPPKRYTRKHALSPLNLQPAMGRGGVTTSTCLAGAQPLAKAPMSGEPLVTMLAQLGDETHTLQMPASKALNLILEYKV